MKHPPKPPLLSEADQIVWQNALTGVRKLPPSDRAEPVRKKRPAPLKATDEQRDLPLLLPAFPHLAVEIKPVLEKQRARQIKQGKIRPTARLDLHGLKEAEAWERLRRFLFRAAAEGHRWVIVVTGKGDREKGAPGILKTQVPRWLEEWPRLVVSAAPALPRDGGSGALYIHLRRQS